VLATALLAVSLIATSGAGASPPVKGGFYDGNDGLTLQVNVAGTRVVRTYLNFATRCNGRRTVGATSVPRNMRIRDGRFSFRGVRRYASTGGTQKQVGVGRFVDGGRRVILSFRQTIDNPSTGQRCDTGRLRLVARTQGVQRYQSGFYAGATGQGRRVTLRILETASGYADDFHTRLRLACDRGADLTEIADFASMRIAEDGTFEGRRRNMRADGTLVTTLRGRLVGTRVRGTLRSRGTLVIGYTGEFEESPVRAECDSGPVRFTARK
jgi:hypothetical protein